MKQLSAQSHGDTSKIYSVLTTLVPTCHINDLYGNIVGLLTESSWDDIDHVFVIDDSKHLKGYIDIAGVINTSPSIKAHEIMKNVEVTLDPSDNRERAIYLALRHGVDIIPVVKNDGEFLGAVTAKAIINIMHEDHIEDTLIASGFRGKRYEMHKLVSSGVLELFKARLPWLVLGLFAGLGLGFISSFFEESLKENISLAYFIPVVAYIADSVGTQSEAIAVRSLSLLKINPRSYVVREFLVGILIGIVVGILGGFGAFIISGQYKIALVVAAALAVASALSAAIATFIPMFFKFIGKDPALGSGPLATAIQDVISVLIYFVFALLII